MMQIYDTIEKLIKIANVLDENNLPVLANKVTDIAIRIAANAASAPNELLSRALYKTLGVDMKKLQAWINNTPAIRTAIQQIGTKQGFGPGDIAQADQLFTAAITKWTEEYKKQQAAQAAQNPQPQ
jgi:hypothetical protein